MTSVRKLLDQMDPEVAQLLRNHARGRHRSLALRSCPACRESSPTFVEVESERTSRPPVRGS